MKTSLKILLPLFLITTFSCSSNSTSNNISESTPIKKDSSSQVKTVDKPSVAFEVINHSDNTSSLSYDIFIKDTTKIKILNDYLINQYNPNKKTFININYFTNKKVAKTYFKKQLSESVSEDEKDRLFKYYIASYKFNPSTGFDQLSFLHN